MTDATNMTYLSQEAYDRLADELARRQGEIRWDIVKKIEAAREEGDLKENGGYHAAKEEQGKNEGRIVQLRHLLEHAIIGVPEAAEGVVTHGMVVAERWEGDDDVEEFLLASREEAATATLTVYSPTSPLGAAVLGRSVGELVEYSLPNGRTARVEIVTAAAYAG